MGWSALGEEWKDSLGKHTLLLRYEQQRRLEAIATKCSFTLNDIHERSTKRHGKLMQKVVFKCIF